jgi:hypothetical protein
VTLEDPLWLGALPGDEAAAPSYSAREWRLLVDALCTAEGVVGLGDLKVGPRGAGANFSVDIAAGKAVVQGDSISGQGKYVAASTAVENRGTGVIAAPASGTRHYLIALRVFDRQSDSGAAYGFDLVIVPPSGTGALAAVPPTAIPLADVSVASGQTSITAANIVDLRPFAASLDVSPFSSKTHPPMWFGARSVYCGSDGRPVTDFLHGLGRPPSGGVATVNSGQAGTGSSLPTHAVLDLSHSDASKVGVRVFCLVPYYVYIGNVIVSVMVW